MIEDVKKILRKPIHGHCWQLSDMDVIRVAQQICQLFETKPDYKHITKGMPFTLNLGNGKKMTLNKPKPDRLLTDNETIVKLQEQLEEVAAIKDAEMAELREELAVGSAITAVLTDRCRELEAECQERVERIFGEIENFFWYDELSTTMGLARSGNKTWEIWQALKKKEGVIKCQQ